MSYGSFLQTKTPSADPCGFDCGIDAINPMLFEFQRDIVRWAVNRGRAAVFADCGMGKTFIQLEWARIIGGVSLIVCPLCVAEQTVAEGRKLGIEVKHIRHGNEMDGDGIYITNYEMIHHFQPDGIKSLVLDESSILKNYTGKYRRWLTDFASGINFRLACTATPAPNDIAELINHAEFLGVMSGKEILAIYFRQDGNTTHKWRLKGHAEKAFWKWMASWAVAISKPSDLDYDDDGFILPPLNIHEIKTQSSKPIPGKLFVENAVTLEERRKARQVSIDDRVAKASALVNSSDEPWVVWCDLNKESDALARAIPDAVEVRGSDDNKVKEDRIKGFTDGKYRVIVTKPSIAGFGLNWQHCPNVVFTGLSDSYEKYYQAVRRCWRFGQYNPVHCYIVTDEAEGNVRENILRKERESKNMFDNLIAEMKAFIDLREQSTRDIAEYETDDTMGDNWKMMLGDCIERIKEIPDNSIGLSVFSPPFPGMYAYTNSDRDIGNCSTIDTLMNHIKFLYPELLRVMKPGRSVCIHLTQMVTFKYLDGYAGLRDFRGRTIDAMIDAGFIYYGEVCIDKDPQVKAIRTKDAGLLFKSLARDSSKMHMAMADYLLQFKKPGDNEEPIKAGISDRYGNSDGWITSEEWIEWAAPVWYRQTEHYPGGIRETDVLEYRSGRTEQDEKHICPLQLGVIERAIKLWSNPGDTVLSPFAGIGSEGYQAIRFGRKFVGIELKRSYYDVACRNIASAKPDQGVNPLEAYIAETS